MSRRHYNPSCSEIYQSFKLRRGEYLRENTLHGFPYFVDSSRPKWERILWLIWTIIALGSAFFIMVTIWHHFQSTPTLISIDVDTENHELIYPSIYVCMSDGHLNVKNVPKSIAAFYKYYYSWKYWNRPIADPRGKTDEVLSKAFEIMTPKCNDLLSNCYKDGKIMECSKLFTKTIIPAGICCKTDAIYVRREQSFENFGIGFRRRIPKTLNIYLRSHTNTPPLRTDPITYSLNREVQFTIGFVITNAAQSLRFLAIKQRSCVFPHEQYLRTICTRRCINKVLHHKCGCLPWYENVHVKDECLPQQYRCLQRNTTYTTPCMTKCHIYCNHTTYEFKQLRNANETQFNIVWPSIVYKRDVAFGWLDLFVSFGGIMGVFLGYSLLTTVEIFYYFTLRTYCGTVIDEDENNPFKKIHISVKPMKPEKDEPYHDFVD